MRKDLPLGFQAAQIVHAAGESTTKELPPNTNAVVLQVSSECRLRELAKKLQIKGIPHTLITEVDEPYNGQCTAIGIVPTQDRSSLKKLLSDLPLLGSENRKIVCGSKPDRAPCESSSTAEYQE